MRVETYIVDQNKVNAPDVIRESKWLTELQGATQNQEKAFYNLLMSMVSQDALDLDQFHQYRTKPTETHDDLYKRFYVQPKLLEGENDPQIDLKMAEAINRQDVTTSNLYRALRISPLVPQKSTSVPDSVITNLDHNIRSKTDFSVDKKEQTTSERQQPSFDVEGWYNNLVTARAKIKVYEQYKDDNFPLETVA